MPPMGFSSWLDSLFAIGMASSFLGAYLSVSLIGLGTTLVLILGSLSIFRKEGFSIVKNNPLFIPIMLLSGAIIISIIFASPYDFEKPLGKLRYLVCFFIFTAFFVRAPQKLNWIERT
ncbi:MAG: hypothetical protein EBZ49_16210 [Proteobacteria bacterium]|nr:hypothetical protein [Pseudomonadota bacterium]